jgi:predicted HNH restriction endonuclease
MINPNADIPLKIRWHTVSKYIDMIPANIFTHERSKMLLVHRMVNARDEEVGKAKCYVTISSKKAIFDYTDASVEKFNKNQRILYGKCYILFKNNKRNLVKRIDWMDGNGMLFKDAASSSWSIKEYATKRLEGGNKEITLEIARRNPQLRADAITKYGAVCQVCGFCFGSQYGHIGDGYIEVHHLHPISLRKHKKMATHVEDVRVVCSNCHRMLHRNGKKPIDFDKFLKSYKRAKRT